ncbi:MAG TPA: hypothetical protein VK914_01750 [bacterium]|jgi:hypothetical protein|nr:hypothetical protein [bacterium]
MKKNLLHFALGAIACMVFSLIHARIAEGLGFVGEFVVQGPIIFASGVLVAMLFKNSKV